MITSTNPGLIHGADQRPHFAISLSSLCNIVRQAVVGAITIEKGKRTVTGSDFVSFRFRMLIGNARIPTGDQETATQESALKQAGCKKIFPESASGGRWGRPQLARALDQLRAATCWWYGNLIACRVR